MSGENAAEAAARAEAEKKEAQSKKAFEDAVRVILTTFGVFTGVVIKSAIEKLHLPESSSLLAIFQILTNFHVFICLATVALLLRFIIGSAVHLNLCYVTEPRSKMPIMLFKDVAFLIVFGLIAVSMINANDVAGFAIRATWFIAAGILWSVVDRLGRIGRGGGEKSLASPSWVMIDIAQLVFGGVVFLVISDPLWRSMGLALIFALALYLDMRTVLLPGKAKG
jgi:hypothetical protein